MLSKLKNDLAQAQSMIKKYADMKRSKRTFSAGDMVYLKLQPFRHHAFGFHQSLKLSTIYYGQFRILDKIATAAYKLQLPESAEIHNVSHVSQLKKHLGARVVPQPNLPLVTADGYIKVAPIEVLDTRALPHRDEVVTQWLIVTPSFKVKPNAHSICAQKSSLHI
jgi:hypothetical protein